jgi:hypothetical protein
LSCLLVTDNFEVLIIKPEVMKKLFLSIVGASVWIAAFATIRTVSNFPSTVAQFNNIQDAITASANGDTIYVHGSSVVYTSFTLTNKNVVIIGPGWSPNKQIPLTAMVAGATVTGTGSSGTEIQGLVMTSSFVISAGSNINNVRIIRCQIRPFTNFIFDASAAPATYTGFLFEGNWFENSNIRNDQLSHTFNNFILQNNLFFENGTVLLGNLHNIQNTANFLIDHNLFYGPGAGTRDVFTGTCRSMIISNNIFVRRNAANSLTLSSFSNNITYNTGSDAPWTVGSNTDGGGNVAGADPQMADQASVDNGTNNPLLNFTIAGGPANNTGSDGKDMGLLFDAAGSLNWTTSRTSRLPFIFSMTITTPTVAPGGNISVTVESRRNN